MHRLSLLLHFVCLAAGSLVPFLDENQQADIHSEGPVRPGAFVGPDGSVVMIEAGDVGLYPTGMFDDEIDYENDVKFILFTRENPSTGQQLYLNNLASIAQSNFNATKLTKFVIHGFMNTMESPMIQWTRDAFLKNDDFNIIVVNWSSLADNILYPIVVSEVPAVGKYVGKFIEFLVANASVEASQIHLVGHSLGAHVTGFAGKQVQSHAGYNVSRISGLDPALPGYILDSSTNRLAKTDADYVDCIHTCAGFKGFLSPICQADFYPNGGFDPQPGCPLFIDFGTCSHGRAFQYFAASVNETNIFHAETCDLFLFDTLIGCSDEGVRMGYPAGVEKYQGMFYLKTTADFPYVEST